MNLQCLLGFPWSRLLIAPLLCIGCDEPAPPSVASAGGAAESADSSLSGSDTGREEQLRAALEEARRQRETGAAANQAVLPNYPSGPLNARPAEVNFYMIFDHYPGYLLCLYDVDEKRYSALDEAKWFEDALGQIRELGPKKFPSVQWIAVTVKNRAEHTGVSDFQQSHKVGTVFSASAVFDRSQSIPLIVAQAGMDRKPFIYDRSGGRPDREQRWMTVERHMARPAQSSE